MIDPDFDPLWELESQGQRLQEVIECHNRLAHLVEELARQQELMAKLLKLQEKRSRRQGV